MKNTVIEAIARLCFYSGSNFLFRPVFGGLGLILVFHRFRGETEKAVDRGGVVSGAFFDKLLVNIKESGPDVIALRDVPHAIKERRQFVCLTMDDGYRDNAEIALPILRRHKVPATIFVPSGALDRSLDAWWLQIEEIAKKEPDPQAAYTRIVAGINSSPEALEKMRASFPAPQKDLNERYFMSAEKVRVIDRDPLIEIGGHTVTHPILKHLPEEKAYREIVQNKADLEELLGRPVEVFAYPFGNVDACGGREFNLAARAGYKIAVTTRDGNVFPEHKDHLTALPRYSVRGFLENLAVFEMQKSGLYRIFKSRFGPAFVTE